MSVELFYENCTESEELIATAKCVGPVIAVAAASRFDQSATVDPPAIDELIHFKMDILGLEARIPRWSGCPEGLTHLRVSQSNRARRVGRNSLLIPKTPCTLWPDVVALYSIACGCVRWRCSDEYLHAGSHH
jgi:hypothetical protein